MRDAWLHMKRDHPKMERIVSREAMLIFLVCRCVLNKEQPLNQSKHKSSNKRNCWVVIIVLCCAMYALKKETGFVNLQTD